MVGSVREFMKAILRRKGDSDHVTAYRGLSDSAYRLQPSVFRAPINREQEHILLRELIAAHPDEFTADQTALEQLVRMQHYALPTRLLDVSWNPLVALYFAAQENRQRKEVIADSKIVTRSIKTSGAVVVLTVARSKIRYFDSDTVSCVANLARLSWEHKQGIVTTTNPRAFISSTPIKRLLHFIRQEKHQFEAEIVPAHLDEVFLVKPKLNNKRILAQNGAFFIFGQTTEISEPNTLGISVERIEIRSASKKRILAELDKLNINEKTLFPEIERAARYLAENLQNALVSTIVSKP
jgi:hypothetical protein